MAEGAARYGFGAVSSGHRTRLVRRRRATTGRGHRGRTVLVILALIPIVALGVIAGVVLLGLQVAAAGGSDLARLGQLSDQQPVNEAETTQIFASDGTVLAYLYGEQNRTVISSEDISTDLKHAIVAIEDQRFYQHNGVDYQGLVRALLADVKAGKSRAGGVDDHRAAGGQPLPEPPGHLHHPEDHGKRRSPCSTRRSTPRTRSSPNTSTPSTSARTPTGSRRRRRPTSARTRRT